MSDLIVRNENSFAIAASITQQKESTLAEAALIGKVRNAAENERACVVACELKALSDSVEKARVELTKPFLAAQRQIKKTADTFNADLAEEYNRLMRECGDFQEEEKARQRAALALRSAELNEIERAKFAALAVARNTEEMEAIQEQACEQAASVPVVEVNKANGQQVKDEWEYEIFDLWALVKNHPNCIKPEPIRSEIKRMLDAGFTLAGVRAKKVVKSSVRLPASARLLEV